MCALLRALAYNLLSLLRSVHLRSAAARAATWRQIRDWMRDTLLWMPSLNQPPNPAREVAAASP